MKGDKCSWGAALKLGFSAVVGLPKNLRRLLRQLEAQEVQAKRIAEARPARSLDEAFETMFGKRDA